MKPAEKPAEKPARTSPSGSTLAWGTYDESKPRTRLMLGALRDAGLLGATRHADIWSAVVDKSQLRDPKALLGISWRWLSSYARLLAGLARSGEHDVVFVGYLGQLDVLVAWPLCRLRHQTIVWDAFISLYDTVVDDRKMVGKGSIPARLLWAWEWLACRAADVVVLDTEAHAAYFRSTFHLADDKTAVVFVGAEPDAFAPGVDAGVAATDLSGPITVLFYGQFIPLHGIATIIEAARRSDPAEVRWVLIGTGQETARVQRMLDEHPIAHLTWIPWVDYDALRAQIAAADVCLGIFGDSDKAGRVIPNKVFQILSVGKPLITRDSDGIRELVDDDSPGVYLVPPADPAALLGAIARFRDERSRLPLPLHKPLVERFSPAALARALGDVVAQATARTHSTTQTHSNPHSNTHAPTKNRPAP